MNFPILIAGLLCLLLGVAHSLFGEVLIFHEKRKKGEIVPSKGGEGLKEKHLRIIWATWHLASFFGWAFGVILVKIAFFEEGAQLGNLFMIQAISISTLTSGLLVFFATKGRHPGWIVLLIISTLLFFSN